ncbi:hypothetical protein B9Z47_12650 [Limnohabitans sp. 2KL-1]|nr:hypothetical protein B9Z47_12650 [Limnohabitans sp. 2KL-1]
MVHMVHMVRQSLNDVSWKMRKVVAADLKTIYSAATADEKLLRVQEFEDQWSQDYPTIVKSWLSNWQRIVPFFFLEYPPRSGGSSTRPTPLRRSTLACER